MSLLLLLSLLGFVPTPAEAQIISPISVEWSTTTAPLVVNAYAHRYGVSFEEMWGTIQCENRELDPTLQSRHLKKDGTRERSFGVAQFNLDWNPNITLKQATDPFWSVEEMAKWFAQGKQGRWSCWRSEFGGNAPPKQ